MQSHSHKSPDKKGKATANDIASESDQELLKPQDETTQPDAIVGQQLSRSMDEPLQMSGLEEEDLLQG